MPRTAARDPDRRSSRPSAVTLIQALVRKISTNVSCRPPHKATARSTISATAAASSHHTPLPSSGPAALSSMAEVTAPISSGMP